MSRAETRYDPELYREYKRRGVQLVLHSYHNAGMNPESLTHYHEHVTFTIRDAASWSSFIVAPTGQVVGRLRRHRAGVLITEIEMSAEMWDFSAYWRGQCLAGVYHSGQTVDDPRSRKRTKL